MKQIVNAKFAPAFKPNPNIRYFFFMGGRGAGRSTAASQLLTAKLIDPEYMRAAIMREVYHDVRHSSWSELKDRFEEQRLNNHLNIGDNEMYVKYGVNSIKAHGFRASSSSQSAKLKSLAQYNVIWIEEAEEISEEEFMTLDDSLRTVKGNIMIIFSLNPPPKSHWIIRRWFDLDPVDGVPGFYIPKLKKNMDDAMFIYSSYLDNIANLDKHTIKRYAEYKFTNPDYYHHKICGYVPETARGRIYSGWRLIDEVPFEARLVSRGMDFGWFPDPMCLVNIYYHNGGYIIDELQHGHFIKNETIAGAIINDGNSQVLTYADSAEPKSIQEIKDLKVNIIGVDKEKGSVIYGIKVLSGIKISVTRRSTHVWDSYENYCWAEDKDGNPKGEPDHFMSDPMDSVRYGIVPIIDTGIDPDRRDKEELLTLKKRHDYKKQQSRKVGI